GEEEVGEERAGPEVRLALARIENGRADDVARHQVRRELDATESHRKRRREALHEQRLADARHTFEKAVPPAEERGEGEAYGRLLSDDDATDRLAHRAMAACDVRDVRRRGVHQ